MNNTILKILSILGLLILAGIRIGYIWKAFSMEIAIDYTIKSVVTLLVLIGVSYIISMLAPKKSS